VGYGRVVRHPIVVTLGGGGAFALGYHLGLAVGLRDGGVDISTSPLMGTSGGSHAAAAIATGMTIDEISPIWKEHVDKARLLWGRAAPVAEALYGGRVVPEGSSAAGVAVRLLGWKRVVLWNAEVPLADLVAASSSIMPFTRPHKVGKRRYVDGGHRSGTSADLAPEADVQLLFAPFSLKSQGFLGRSGARRLRKETPKWEQRTSGHIIAVLPTNEMGALSKGMRVIGDMDNAKKVHDLAIPVGKALASTLLQDHAEVVARLHP
jgi:predicted acylesterase/phospholipase RssA